MLSPGTEPSLYLHAGLQALTPPLRSFVIGRMSARFGREWWKRCLSVSPFYVRENCGTEIQVRQNSDASFWLRMMTEFWHECFAQGLGTADHIAVMSLREYRNQVSHEFDKLSARDVYQALAAIKVVLGRVSPNSVPDIEELMLGLRLYHPESTLSS